MVDEVPNHSQEKFFEEGRKLLIRRASRATFSRRRRLWGTGSGGEIQKRFATVRATQNEFKSAPRRSERFKTNSKTRRGSPSDSKRIQSAPHGEGLYAVSSLLPQEKAQGVRNRISSAPRRSERLKTNSKALRNSPSDSKRIQSASQQSERFKRIQKCFEVR